MLFHERLRQLRKDSGISQIDIAKMIDVAPITLRQYEQGKREPTIEKLMQLAMIFGVTLDDLLCFDDYRRTVEASADEG